MRTLIVHRALIRALKLGDDGLPTHTTREELVEIERPDFRRRAPRHGGRARDHRPPDRPSPRRPHRRRLRRPDLGRHQGRAVHQARRDRRGRVRARVNHRGRLLPLRGRQRTPCAASARAKLIGSATASRSSSSRRRRWPARCGSSCSPRATSAAGRPWRQGGSAGENRQADDAAPVKNEEHSGSAALTGSTMAERQAGRPRPPFCRPSAAAFSAAARPAARPAVRPLPQGRRGCDLLRDRVPPPPRRRSAALHRHVHRRPYRRLRHPPGRNRVRRAALAPSRGLAGPDAVLCARCCCSPSRALSSACNTR